MNSLSWYALGALASIGLTFYAVRKIPVYAAICLVVVLAHGVLTWPLVDLQSTSEWIVSTAGLALCVFGLLIVRVMLIRSVSLRMLRRIDEGGAETMEEDIGGRLPDMRAFKLIGAQREVCELTPFGRVIGTSVAAFYALFRIGT